MCLNISAHEAMMSDKQEKASKGYLDAIIKWVRWFNVVAVAIIVPFVFYVVYKMENESPVQPLDNPLVSGVFVYLFAKLLALAEIEMEGSYGWAEKMPTYYRTEGCAARIYGRIMSKRPLTGYHAIMFVMIPMIFHIHFFSGSEWSFHEEFRTLGRYVSFCPVWDFLWFVLNPAYGIKKFRKENIWWHAKVKWIGRVPLDYIVGVVASVVFTFLAGNLEEHLQILLLWSILLLFTVALAPMYRRWRVKMDKRDDRDKADIFHRD